LQRNLSDPRDRNLRRIDHAVAQRADREHAAHIRIRERQCGAAWRGPMAGPANRAGWKNMSDRFRTFGPSPAELERGRGMSGSRRNADIEKAKREHHHGWEAVAAGSQM